MVAPKVERRIYVATPTAVRVHPRWHLPLAGVDQTLLNDLVSFLDPFLEASLAFEGDKSPTLHRSMPWLYKLKNHCVPLADDGATIRAVKQRATDLLEEKFSLQTIHYVAAALNPKMKHLKMMDAQPTHKEAVYTSMRQMIAVFDNGNDTLGLEMTANAGQVQEQAAAPVPIKKPRQLEEFEDDDVDPVVETDEVKNYLSLRTGRETMDNILQWWKGQEKSLPRLSRLARRLLCVPASSAASERAFSAAGCTITQRRTALDPDTVDKILFMKSNKQ